MHTDVLVATKTTGALSNSGWGPFFLPSIRGLVSCKMLRVYGSDTTNSSSPIQCLRMLITTILTLLSFPGSDLSAQSQSQEGWNGLRTLDLVRQARDLRQKTSIDSSFQAYKADADGYVYFLLDSPEKNRRALVKTDQIALKIYWRAPKEIKQQVIGLRDDKRLPTNIKYHADHLTVVQDDFGDLIRLGDGDEVSAVVHPVAPGSEEIYDFRIADSLTLSLPGPDPDIRVYDLEVRPKNPEAPGVIGSVFLERKAGAILRMNLTFTPASYVDENLDYIRISMNNSVWDGKYWLPYHQEIELRRALPTVDFLAGSIIRSRFDIRNYHFNPELPDHLFFGNPVSSLPKAIREDFPFKTGLYDQIDEHGLKTSMDIQSVREQTITALGQSYLSGLSSFRLHIPYISSLYRYNRAEGSFGGLGASLKFGSEWRINAHSGYSFGRDQGQFSLDFGKTISKQGLGVRVRVNELKNVSEQLAGSNPTTNTLMGLLADQDYTDPYFSSNAELGYTWTVGGYSMLSLNGVWERHSSGENVVSPNSVRGGIHRSVRNVDEGTGWALEGSYSNLIDIRGFRTLAKARIGNFNSHSYASLWWDSSFQKQLNSLRTTIEGRVQIGLSSKETPYQSLYLLGGRHTLPGYSYRSFIGNRMLLMRIEGSQSLLKPWLSIHAFAVTGKIGLSGQNFRNGWPNQDSDGFKSSAGMGIGLGWDLLRFDVGKGLDEGGDWEFIFSVKRSFWEWL